VKYQFILLLAAAVLISGCAGSGQQDTPTASGGARQQFIVVFSEGFSHHTTARGLFENATDFWNADDYDNASALLTEARGEYGLASRSYHDLAAFAGNDSERAFAANMEEAAIDMDEASARYLLSINESLAGNDTNALTYFEEGQAFFDRSMVSLNQSIALTPAWLER
jgi:hypothetical protein